MPSTVYTIRSVLPPSQDVHVQHIARFVTRASCCSCFCDRNAKHEHLSFAPTSQNDCPAAKTNVCIKLLRTNSAASGTITRDDAPWQSSTHTPKHTRTYYCSSATLRRKDEYPPYSRGIITRDATPSQPPFTRPERPRDADEDDGVLALLIAHFP